MKQEELEKLISNYQVCQTFKTMSTNLSLFKKSDLRKNLGKDFAHAIGMPRQKMVSYADYVEIKYGRDMTFNELKEKSLESYDKYIDLIAGVTFDFGVMF
ncbi:hypothetical protein HOD29_06835 [archaeon]|jgi:hypothetical protein|nr:hypothetical protein [archaeon]